MCERHGLERAGAFVGEWRRGSASIGPAQAQQMSGRCLTDEGHPGRNRLPADVTSKDDIQKLVSQVSQSEPKGIQLLVNNAGIARDDATKYANSKPDLKDAKAISEHLWKVGPESWSDTFATNVTALYFVGAAFLPLLDQGLKNTPGFSPSIINITSISGVMKGGSMGQFSYASSKAAAIHLTRMMASTFAETKIRVNSIAPGTYLYEASRRRSQTRPGEILTFVGAAP